MPLTEFTCPNGHGFSANAKLRARCPECGAMARKFGPKPDLKPDVKPEPEPEPDNKPDNDPEPEPKVKAEPEPPVKKTPKIIRRGKTREHRVVAKPAAKTVVTKTRGIIKHKKVSGKTAPVVRGKPRGSKEHKVTATGQNRPYWHDVSDKYWG